MTNQMQQHNGNESFEHQQSAVSLTPDILRILEETRDGAMEELESIGDYNKTDIGNTRLKYTVDDVIEHLETMDPDEYRILLDGIKASRSFDSLIIQNQYVYNPFELKRCDAWAPEKKYYLIRKMLGAGFRLDVPLEDKGVYIHDFTGANAERIGKDEISSLNIKKLSRLIHETVSIYSDYIGPDFHKRKLLSILEGIANPNEDILWLFNIKLSLSGNINEIGDISGNKSEKGTLLLYFIKTENWGSAYELLLAGADPEVKDKNGISPIEYLQNKSSSGIYTGTMLLKMLDDMKKRRNEINEIKSTSVVVSQHRLGKLGDKIKKTLNLETRDDDLDTAFMKAVKNREFELMKYLANSGANTSPVDLDLNTPLINAIEGKDSEMVRKLVKITNKDGFSMKGRRDLNVLEMSKMQGMVEYIELIENRIKEIGNENNQ